MKSSTRNNFSALIRQELVKRFENVVKEEVKNHNIAVEKTNHDILELKAMFKENKSLLDSIICQMDAFYDKSNKNFLDNLNIFQKQQTDQSQYLGRKEKDIDTILKQQDEKCKKFVDQNDFYSFTKLFSKEINEIKQKIETYKQDLMECIYESKQQNAVKTKQHLDEMQQFIDRFGEKLENFNQKLGINMVDAQGISRSLKVDQKSIFVLEKKIENLYTLIERLNKIIGGEVLVKLV